MPQRTPDRNDRTQRFGPEPVPTTAPMPPSPYGANRAYPPPPPPPPLYTAPPAVSPPPSAYGGMPGVNRPPAGAPRNRGGSFIGGIVAAIIVVVLAGVGIAALNGGLSRPSSVAGHTGVTPPAGVATTAPGTTPAPTDSPTFTPTAAPPTVTPSPNPHAVPTPISGFATYLPQGDDWGLNYRVGSQIHAQTSALPGAGQNVTAIIFDLGHSATFTVYDLAQPIPADQAQTLFDAVTAALHATDVQILDQGATQLGANSWAVVHLRATIAGQRYEGYCLYAPHGTSANAVSMVAPVGDGFTSINTTDFTPMIDSFTYLA